MFINKTTWQNNPNKSYIERKAIHEPFGYSLDLVSSFDPKQNKHSFYRGRDCAQKVCKDLEQHTIKIINFKEKDMIPITNKDIDSSEKQKVCHIFKTGFCYKTIPKS